MDTPAPPFEVTETAIGRVYRLPERHLGALHYLAALPLFVALGSATLLVQMFISRAGRQLDEWAWSFLILTTLGWGRACYTLASLAASLWNGRTEIRVGDDTSVAAADCTGWFRLRLGKLKAGAARKLILAEIVLFTDASGKRRTVAGGLWQLSVETDGGRKTRLAIGHPRGTLSPLADELASRLALAPVSRVNPETGEAVGEVELAPIPVVVEEPAVPNRDVFEQPADSRIEVERHPDGVTVSVPPLGVVKSGCGLLAFGTIFSIIGVTLLVSFINQQFAPAPPRGNQGPTWLGIVFLGVGVGAIVGTIHFGRKRAALAVVRDRLLTLETGPLGSRRRSFIRAELLDIACGPSNVSSNDKSLPQLQILVHGGVAPVGMLTGRDETELKWLATALRQALGLPSEAPEHRKPAG